MKLTIVIFLSLVLIGQVVWAQQTDEQLDAAAIRRQIEEMQATIEQLQERLEKLDAAVKETKKTQEADAPTVTAASRGSRIRIDARMFAGLFGSGDEGSYENWSTDIRDAKLRFTYTPSNKITVVNRLSTTGATAGDFDYFYVDFNEALSPTNTIRVGQRKVDVGQETWTDNPVENMLVSTSASGVSGYATGVALLGRFKDTRTSPLYEVGFLNGPRGVMARPTNSLPFNIKLGLPLPRNLFASASYFDSGNIGGDDRSAISVGGLTAAPGGATEWDRKLWELDLRYNYGSSGIRPLVPTGELPPVMLGATYGAFNDSATGAADRDGDYWFIEGLARLTPRVYGAARHSVVNLDNGTLAKLGGNPVDVNSYKRTSIGLGYALRELTHLKLEYTINDTSGGASDPDLNQWAIGVASKF